jgi:hypothetical protein
LPVTFTVTLPALPTPEVLAVILPEPSIVRLFAVTATVPPLPSPAVLLAIALAIGGTPEFELATVNVPAETVTWPAFPVLAGRFLTGSKSRALARI